ncbi:hypothetical protein DACRYDRAFT_109525 [Dacryopinax primogenitus]|uniref:Uncharacterized protein n=1 Tax=Dacryopinax primogenitus (strain DJM 731) TaxID=1858805 RepID=M5FV23_DACPD|nr:uncharacterized protein DACRYDRAFT_109525 [Dacryopinax primogenitus]EJU00104.1 hypothetical protein DACRYDRAFT_109525 [Dacryopinax primogenitus]
MPPHGCPCSCASGHVCGCGAAPPVEDDPGLAIPNEREDHFDEDDGLGEDDDWNSPKNVTLKSWDRLEQSDELKTHLLKMMVHVILPVGNEEDFSCKHPMAQSAGNTKSTLNNLAAAFHTIRMQCCKFPIVLQTSRNNIINWNDIAHNVLASNSEASLKKYAQFRLNSQVTMVTSILQIQACQKYYCVHCKELHNEHPWWYVQIFFTEDLMHPDNCLLLDSLASNSTAYQHPPTASEIWFTAVDIHNTANYTHNENKTLITATFGKYLGAIWVFNDDIFIAVISGVLEFPAWEQLCSFNMLKDMWNSEGHDIFYMYMFWQTKYFCKHSTYCFGEHAITIEYDAIMDWHFMKICSDIFLQWFDKFKAWANNPQHNVNEAYLIPYSVMLIKALNEIYNPVDPMQTALVLPDNHYMYGKQWVAKVQMFFDEYPTTIILTPCIVLMIVRLIDEYEHVFKEVAWWVLLHYKHVSKGTGMQAEGEQPPMFAMLLANTCITWDENQDLHDKYICYVSTHLYLFAWLSNRFSLQLSFVPST